MPRLIIHIADIEISETSGMGRVAWNWRRAFQDRGYEFLHIGAQEIGKKIHKRDFPSHARFALNRLQRSPDCLLVHEPASGHFIQDRWPFISFSHGIERRAWLLRLKRSKRLTLDNLKLRYWFPVWRLRSCDKGLTHANKVFLINQEDSDFAQYFYGRSKQDIFQFRNGIIPAAHQIISPKREPVKILFIGAWIERKGIKSLVEAAQQLMHHGIQAKWLLAGTSVNKDIILRDWPQFLHPFVQVIPSFSKDQEQNLLLQSDLFVLPSLFEGQPLSLIQAMAMGLCCISTNCCGQKDLIQSGFNGLLHEPGNSDQLAFLIRECLTNTELRLALGKNAQQSVSSRSWDRVSNEVVDHVESVILHSKSRR